MTKEEAKAAIIEFFENKEEIFNDAIEELDSYNGYLGDDRYYYMEDLKELYCDTNPIELLQRAYFGHDAETWHTDAHGNKEYGEFNPNREYFYFNGYGNFVSADYKDYSCYLDHYFIDELERNRGHIWNIKENEELNNLFDELEEAE